MDDATLKVGLLMEAAQTQQKAVESMLQRLTSLADGLDAVVREELRQGFIEEFQALGAASRAAEAALDRVRHAASRRIALWAIAVVTASSTAPLFVAWAIVPSPAEIARLRAQREKLAQSIAELGREGGHIELRRCGDSSRLCVRVDRSAPVYGTDGDYVVLRGP
jgi:hypothetical protein